MSVAIVRHAGGWTACDGTLVGAGATEEEARENLRKAQSIVAGPRPERRLEVVPISLAEANAFVRAHHRHHGEVRGYKFAVAVAGESAQSGRPTAIVGVAIAGRPVARGLDDGWTVEVTRCCTVGNRNAPSALYGACARAAFALGYRRVVTYTLASESGTTLRAAGWRVVAEVKGRSWSCASRPRVDKHPTQDKIRWEVQR